MFSRHSGRASKVTDVVATTMPPGAIEHEGRWWKAEPGATVTFDEFLAAKVLFKEINGVC